MKTSNLILCLGTLALLTILSGRADQKPAPAPIPLTSITASNIPGPRIQFATPIYDFGRVKAGDPVKYNYIFTNTGDQMLEISHVQPQCGCTAAADWTKKVEPGQTGSIPIQFNSTSFNGQVLKTISVSSNDKQKPVVILQIKGTIWKPIELVPPYSVLTVPPDSGVAAATVKIINNMEEPLSLEAPECNQPSFKAELKPTQPGKEFELVLSPVPPLNAGSTQGKVTLKTSAPGIPVLEVPFWVNVQPPLNVIPQQLMLPQAPLAAKTPVSVTIQNNSTNKLALTEPSISIPGVDVTLREVQEGRLFSIVMTFPQGFEISPGQQVSFTVKTSNPKIPLVRVPVMQLPRPAVVAPISAPQTPSRTVAAPPPLPPMPTPRASN